MSLSTRAAEDAEGEEASEDEFPSPLLLLSPLTPLTVAASVSPSPGGRWGEAIAAEAETEDEEDETLSTNPGWLLLYWKWGCCCC